LQKERLIDSDDLKFIFTVFNKEIKYSNKAIDKLLKEKDIKIKREEESLFLNNKKLNDENIKCISLIKINHLTEIDLSENEITNIEPLCKINLPFLEILNLSYNKIKNIEPLSEISTRKLKYLFLQNNQIEDIQVFLDDDFPKLEILRLENNNINENSNSFKKLLELYNKDYIKNILLSSETKTKTKKLKDCKIKDIQALKDINYPELEMLNLQNNNIMNISAFKEFNYPNLEILNLKNNNIMNISPLKDINYPDVENLDLSFNHIMNFPTLKKFNYPNLEILNLQNNNKKGIQVLNDFDYSKLDKLRLKHINIKEIELYNNNILFANKIIGEIKKNYNIDYNEEKEIIEVEGTMEGDSMLRNLSIIMSQKNKNKIRKLKLPGNRIENPSILNRIQFDFDFLEEFDLSKNNIKNLEFLKGMKAKNLKRLNLSFNYINDISPLEHNINKFPHLEFIALNNNNFNPEDSKYADLFNTLKEHRIEIITKSN